MTSISRTVFSFFTVSAITLFVTLWAFWDDEYARRGYKVFQEEYFKEQFAISEASWKNVNADIGATEKQIKERFCQIRSLATFWLRDLSIIF